MRVGRELEVLSTNEQVSRKVSEGSALGFRGDIQGLRAVAVGAVVLYHAGVPFLPGGYVGVDIFFVISGFLITIHLLAEFRRDGKIRFASFYARRARRILPASIVVLALSLGAALIWYPPLLMGEVTAGAIATAFYVPNILFAVQRTDYLAETIPSLFQYYWSLGIEEQFYLVWPAILALGFLLSRRPRHLLVLVSTLVALSFVACVILTMREPSWAFFLLPTRAWELGAGGLVAFLLFYRPYLIPDRVAIVLGWAGLVGIIASVLTFSSDTLFPGYWAAVPVLSTVAVITGGSKAHRFGPSRLLSLRGLAFVGLISYSLYLVHWPILLIVQAVAGFETPLRVWAGLGLALVSVPVAWLLYTFVETPGRTAPFLSRARPRRTLLSALAASVCVTLLALAANTYSTERPLFVQESVAAVELDSPPIGSDIVPSNLETGLRAASGDQAELYEDGCHVWLSGTQPLDCVYGDPADPRIVLFGDSHAAHWFPALVSASLASGYSLETHTKSACPSVLVAVLRDGVAYTECAEWRERVIEKINSEQPSLVVLSNSDGAALATTSSGRAAEWESGLAHTLESIRTATIVIADTPSFTATPALCLSAHLSDAYVCDLDATGRDLTFYDAERSAAAAHGSEYVDFTDYFCGPTTCPAIIGNVLVYRDSHHITATFSSQFAPLLEEAIRRNVEPTSLSR